MWTALALTMAGVQGCATLSPLPKPAASIGHREREATIDLHGQPLDLHLSAPVTSTPPAHALVLYASGDGGWFGAAVGMFRTIAASGYPVVGISSRAFLHIERPSKGPLSLAQVAADYAAILARARRELALAPETPAILTGWSRGAALAVLASEGSVDARDAAGVIAIGLANREDLRVDAEATDDDDPVQGEALTSRFAPYEILARHASMPSAVIQASGDAYLPAAQARRLFGHESPTHRFVEVPGRNHRFGGAEQQFVHAFGDVLHWIAGCASSAAAPAVARRSIDRGDGPCPA